MSGGTSQQLLVGAYTADGGGTARGIQLIELDANGVLHDHGIVVETESPTFLARSGDTIIACAEHATRIDSFQWQGDLLVRVAGVPAAGSLPCHLSIVGGDVIVSSYGDGVVARHPLAGNGSAGEFAQALAPTFGDAEPNRGGGHAHCSLLLPDGRVATLDLGADAVHVHTIGEDGALVRVATTWLTPGSGPRHMALHPSGQLYVLCELANVVAILDSDLAVIDYTEAAPADAGDASEIAIGSDGRFVYAAIRDADILVVFRVEDGGRRLVRVADVPTGGRGPRHFVVLGERILVGNQLTNTVDVFDIGSDGVPVHRRQLPVKSPTFLLPL